MSAIVIGGIGFPVLYDLRSKWTDPRHWSLHTKLTLSGTAVLLGGGFLAVLLFEWSNPGTLGPMAWADKMLSAAFVSVSARTAGFNAIDIGALTHESWALHYFLMFIGGGSAGTAGGVKVGTVAILALMVIAEIRGRPDVEVFGRRVGSSAQRRLSPCWCWAARWWCWVRWSSCAAPISRPIRSSSKSFRRSARSACPPALPRTCRKPVSSC